MSMDEMATWLSKTPLSKLISDPPWIIPTLQTIHILGVSIIMSSIIMLNFRLLRNLYVTATPSADAVRRFFPWIWVALCILATTGTLLIIGEPARELMNWSFRIKMILLAFVCVITRIFQITLSRDNGFWHLSKFRRNLAGGMATLSLILWVSILTCGRWIAYTQTT